MSATPVLHRVILSANEHGNHIEFCPVVCQAYRRLFGAKVSVAFVTHRETDSPMVRELARYAEVVLFRETPGIPSQNLTKVARYLAAMRYPDEVCLINDIDLLPLQTDYVYGLLAHRRPGELLAVGAEVYAPTLDKGKFPIGNMAAEGVTFREVFNPNGLTDAALLETWKGLRVFDLKEAVDADPAMFSDESLVRVLVSRWKHQHRIRHAPRGFYPYEDGAVDRAHWEIDLEKLKRGGYKEAHLMRPMRKYWDKIWPLILHVMGDEADPNHWTRVAEAIQTAQKSPAGNPFEVAYAHLAQGSKFGQHAALVNQGLMAPEAAVAAANPFGVAATPFTQTASPAPLATGAAASDPLQPASTPSLPIAIVTETMNYTSGGIRCIAEVLNRLVDRGFQASCFVTIPDLRCDWLPVRFPIRHVSELRDFKGILISPYSPTAELVARSNAVGKFYWVHSYEPKFPEITGRPDTWRIMSENSYRLPQLHYFATSTYVKMILELIYKRDVLSPLVPGGVDTSLFRPGQKKNRPLRVMFLSRENPFRGARDIIEALRLVRAQGIELEICVMGQPLDMQGLPHTHYPPLAQRDFAALLGTADIFIHGSHFEGLPLPPLEAMASKCAVIATYIGASDYLLDGYNALVVPPKRPDKIAEALYRLATNPELRTRLGEGGFQTVVNGYTWEHTVDRLVEALEEGLQRQGLKLTSAPSATTAPAVPPPSPAQATIPPEATSFLDQAEQAYNRKDLRAAQHALLQATQAAPDRPVLLSALGNVSFQIADHPTAARAFTRLTQLEPNRAAHQVRLAMSLVAMGQVEPFEAAIGQALALEPNNFDALKLLADLNLQTSNFAEAARLYTRLIQQKPGDVDLLLSLGKAFFQIGEIEGARDVYREVLRLQPDNAVATEALRLVDGDTSWLPQCIRFRTPPDGAGSMEINGIAGFLIPGDVEYLFNKAKALPSGAKMAEIGSFMGLSSVIMMRACQYAGNSNANLVCVDTWRGSPGHHQTLEVVQKDLLYQRFLDNLRKGGVERMVTPVREASVKAAAQFADQTFDFIFIDGDHSFEGCYGDMVAWYPKLKPGGVFIGHDCAPTEGVHQALLKFAAERQLRYTITEPPGAHYAWEIFPSGQGSAPAPTMPVAEASPIAAPSKPTPPPAPPVAEPIVSAIVSAYKSERFIRGCLEDLEAQTIADRLEIIVVDTASPENEGAIVKEFQQRYRNIQYLRTEQRETVYGAWNRGLRAARGKYITNANTDDRHRRDHLEILVRNLEQNPDVALAYADVLITRTENETFDTAHPTGTYHWLDFKPLDLLTKGCFVGPQPVWRRSLHDTHGYFDDTFVTAGDYEFWLRIASRQRFLHVKETLGLYLESPGSVEHTNRDRGARECQEAQNRHREAILAISPKPAPGAPPLAAPLKPVSDLSLPQVGTVGRLKSAYDFLAQRKLEQAWQATLTALTARPFHPEAFVLLGEIAEAAGDWRVARQCAERAQGMAPAYALPKQLLKRLRNNQGKAAKWARLPQTLLGSVPRLSVCVIAKNEEKFLARCLDSIKPIAHQIVLVDTGSTDGTVKLAEERGAEIHHFTWNDDFSDARNEALKYATGDWILVLDADEELPAAEHSKLQADMREKGIMGYRLPLLNHGAESEGVCYVPRLFRNAPGLFFFGRVHEQIFPSILARCSEWGLETKLGSATLMHYGYTAEVTQSRQKVERNLRLLRQAVLEWPDEPNVLMNLGLELVRSGELDEGLSYYRQALFKMGQQPAELHVPELRETLLTQLASHLHRAKAYEEIVQTLNTSVAKAAGLTSTLHWVLGLAYFELKRLPEAAEQMRQCIAKRQQPCLSPVNRDVLTGAPHHCLAMCLLKLGDHDAAERQLLAALKESPESRPILKDYAKFLADRGRPVEALQQLLQLVNQQIDDVAVWLYGAQIALSRPEFLEFASDWTGQASQHLPDHPQVGHQRAETLMLTGDAPGALALWRRFPLEDAAAQAAQLVLGEMVSGANPGLVPAHLEPAASQRFIQWYRHLVQFGASQAISTINANLNRLAAALPSAATALRQVVAEAEAG